MLTPTCMEMNFQCMYCVAVVMLIAMAKHGTTIVNRRLLFCRTKENVNTNWNKQDNKFNQSRAYYISQAYDVDVE